MVLMRAMRTLLGLCFGLAATTGQAFVLLSGPAEAKLPAAPANPEIVFKLSPDHPPFDKKEDFLGGIYKDLDDDQFWPTLVQETMNIWNNVEGSYIQLKAEVDGSAALDPNDRTYSIKTGNLPKTAAASALPRNEDDTIFDCDITISKGKQEARDLAYTLLHELGHCLGLGHNHTNYNAVMGYSRLSRSLWLSPDDKAGVIYLYKEVGTRETEELVSCGSVGRAGDNRRHGWLIALAPLVTLAVSGWNAQRRRSRPRRLCP